MNSSPPPSRRFLPTLTEVVSMSELPQQHPVVRPETMPVARVVEQAFLKRLDQFIDQLLGDEPDDLARAALAQKLEILRQCLHQEFGAHSDSA
jgi:hypothetical protein